MRNEAKVKMDKEMEIESLTIGSLTIEKPGSGRQSSMIQSTIVNAQAMGQNEKQTHREGRGNGQIPMANQ